MNNHSRAASIWSRTRRAIENCQSCHQCRPTTLYKNQSLRCAAIFNSRAQMVASFSVRQAYEYKLSTASVKPRMTSDSFWVVQRFSRKSVRSAAIQLPTFISSFPLKNQSEDFKRVKHPFSFFTFFRGLCGWIAAYWRAICIMIPPNSACWAAICIFITPIELGFLLLCTAYHRFS